MSNNQTEPVSNNIQGQIKIAEENFSFCVDSNKSVYATPINAGSGATVTLNGNEFKEQYKLMHLQKFQKNITRLKLEDLVDIISIKVKTKNKSETVSIRTGVDGNKLIYDTGTDFLIFDKIVNVLQVKNCEKIFMRPSNIVSLPPFSLGGRSFDLLKKYLTLNDIEYRILLSFITYSMIDLGAPYPILILNGEKGSAKSTTSKVIKTIIDNTQSLIESFPSKEDDIYIVLKNSHLTAFDNLSGINGKMSDTLCKVSTGVAYSKRTLYSDDRVTCLKLRKPLILNGIDNIAKRGDIQDRSIVFNLKSIPNSERRAEKEFWTSFNEDFPDILSAIFTLISEAYQKVDTIKLEDLPRMADFAKWSEAIYQTLDYTDSTFLEDFSSIKNEARQESLDSCLIFQGLKWLYTEVLEPDLSIQNDDFKEGKFPSTKMTTSNLYKEIVPENFEKEFKKRFPSIQSFSRELKRLIPQLREEGIFIEELKRSSGERLKSITFTKPFTYIESFDKESGYKSRNRNGDFFDLQDSRNINNSNDEKEFDL
ncbi:hypothetical protein A9Q84_07195 [Halobacteriovorax marinus]|uniref:ATP-binding protein n=1 Tax=Halobacteriovorax marinus TaxID=97084 RepID=A0A1Y5FAY8_9BACT|nr:hypothetical protein A9Q84_07195 [Halobacteriovorax marinus]